MTATFQTSRGSREWCSAHFRESFPYTRGAQRVVITLEVRRRVEIWVEKIAVRSGVSLEPRLIPFGGRGTNARGSLVSFDKPDAHLVVFLALPQEKDLGR